MHMLERRKLLVMTSAVGTLVVLAGSVTAFVVTDRYRGWIKSTLLRALPGYDLEPAGLDRFIDEYNARKPGNAKLRLFAAAEGITNAKWALPSEMVMDMEDEERLIVSDYLLGSDFFQNYPDGPKTIRYSGLAEACISPFASF